MRAVATALAAALAALPSSPAARDRGEGAGERITQDRPLAGFLRVELRAPLDVEVTEGRPFAVAVTLERGLQPLVETRVEGEALVVGLREPLPRGGGKVTIALPELRALALEGSGDARVAGADLPRAVALSVAGSGDLAWTGRAGALSARIDGSGDVKLSGAADALTASVRGSGDLEARGLVARSASVSIEGSGDVEVTVDGGPLSASVAGSGDVTWWGKASIEAVSVAGSGSVRHR